MDFPATWFSSSFWCHSRSLWGHGSWAVRCLSCGFVWRISKKIPWENITVYDGSILSQLAIWEFCIGVCLACARVARAHPSCTVLPHQRRVLLFNQHVIQQSSMPVLTGKALLIPKSPQCPLKPQMVESLISNMVLKWWCQSGRKWIVSLGRGCSFFGPMWKSKCWDSSSFQEMLSIFELADVHEEHASKIRKRNRRWRLRQENSGIEPTKMVNLPTRVGILPTNTGNGWS